MPARPSRAGVALLLGGVLLLFVSVIAQLATTDGVAQTLWTAVSVAAAVVIAVAVAVLIRRARGDGPPEE